jgi:hypothetical protein
MARVKAALESLGLLADLVLKLGAVVLVVWILSLSNEVVCDPPGDAPPRDGAMDRVVDFVRGLAVAEDYFARRQEKCDQIEEYRGLVDAIDSLRLALERKSEEAESLRARLARAEPPPEPVRLPPAAGRRPAPEPAPAPAPPPPPTVAAEPEPESPLPDSELADLRRQAAEAIETGSSRLDRLYAQVQTAAPPPEALGWAVVAGADATLPAALHEAERLAGMAEAGDPAILWRAPWYRTVARFPTREAAQRAAPRLARALNRETFVRALSDWCPGAAPERREGVEVLVCN